LKPLKKASKEHKAMDRNEVKIAFEILLEEIEMVVNNLNDAGADAFKKGDYNEAKRVIEVVTRLADFRERVKTLSEEWSTIFRPQVTTMPPKKIRRRLKPYLARGLRTPEEAYRRPILEALAELGGQGPLTDVLSRVEAKMKGILNEHDYEPLRSNPKEARWRNTAKWCRNMLVREGLMKADSPWGIWEISDRGREALRLGQV
jgi:hypothetical protein